MARGGARPGAGAKRISEQVCRIADINRCWDVVMQFINDESQSLKERAEMASRIAVKAIPTEIKDTDKVLKTGITLVMSDKTKVDLSNGDTTK